MSSGQDAASRPEVTNVTIRDDRPTDVVVVYYSEPWVLSTSQLRIGSHNRAMALDMIMHERLREFLQDLFSADLCTECTLRNSENAGRPVGILSITLAEWRQAHELLNHLPAVPGEAEETTGMQQNEQFCRQLSLRLGHWLLP